MVHSHSIIVLYLIVLTKTMLSNSYRIGYLWKILYCWHSF